MKGSWPAHALRGILFISLVLGCYLAGSAPSEASSSPPANATRLLPGLYLQEDMAGRAVDTPWLQGSQRHVGWAQLEPQQGVFDFGALDSWLSGLAKGGRKGVFGVWLRCADNAAGEDACAPGWALAWDPIMSNGKSRLNYLDPRVQQAIGELVAALAQRYARDERVAYVEIAPGFAGTASPCPISLAVPDRAAECAAYEARYGPASDGWEQYATWLIILYGEQFRQAAGPSHVPLQAVITGKYRTEAERAALVSAALAAGAGLHDLQLMPDFRFGERQDGRCAQDWQPGNPGYSDQLAYQGHWVPLERLWRTAPVSFSMEEWHPETAGQLDEEAYMWWSVLNALDKHASTIHISENALRWLQPWRYFQRYAGHDVHTTPDVWIAFRGSRPGWCPDIGDYEWFLYRREDAAGGSQVAYTPEQGWVGKGWQGAFSRGTDIAGGNLSLYLDVDDHFLYGGQWVVQVEVTYWDGTAEMAGLSWELAYDGVGAPGQVAGTVTLTGTDRWLMHPFVLTDASFRNRLPDESGKPGSDLRLSATAGSDIRFHMVRVRKLIRVPDRSLKPEFPTPEPDPGATEMARQPEPIEKKWSVSAPTVQVEVSAQASTQVEPQVLTTWGGGQGVSQEGVEAGAEPQAAWMASPTVDAGLVLIRAQNDFGGVRDTFLDASRAQENYGAANVLLLKGDGSARALLAFDLSKVPKGSRVASAWLELSVVGRNAPGSMIAWLFEIKQPWDDGRATWEFSVAEIPWETPGLAPGVDYDVRPIAAVLLPAQGILQVPITGLVQKWVTYPEQNHGILVVGQGDSALEYYLFSSEWRQAVARPRLRVRLGDDGNMLAAHATQTAKERDGMRSG